MSEINLGGMKIPAITPIKGIDYYTETEKQEISKEIYERVKKDIEPYENERNDNEQIRNNHEHTRTENENDRNIHEQNRQSQENYRIQNEEIREQQEIIRVQQEEIREQKIEEQVAKTDSSIKQIIDMTEQYNSNASDKVIEYNNNAVNKMNEFDNKVALKIEEFTDSTGEVREQINSNSQDISNIEAEQISQNTNIQTNADNIANNMQNIENLNQKNTEQDSKLLDMENHIDKLEIEKKKLQEKLKMQEDNMIDGNAEGEMITVNDSANYTCDIDISGNSKQETRSGKNKFKLPESATMNGITYTNNGDGTFDLVGTATNNAIFYIYLDTINSGIINEENYTLSSNIDFSSNVYCGIESYNDTIWSSVVILANDGNTKTQVLDITGNKLRFSIRVLSGETVNLTNAKIQLEKGSTATEWEQYGASPSIDYPSEIKCCGGNINLFDGNFRQGSVSNIGEKNRLYSTQELILKANKTYTISTNLDISKYRYSINILTETPPTTSSIFDAGWKTNSTYTFTFTKEGYEEGYLGIPISKIDNTNLTLEDIEGVYFKLEEGTIATSWSPYNELGNIDVSISNKNILPLFDYTKTSFGVSKVEFKDNKVTFNKTDLVSSGINANRTTNWKNVRIAKDTKLTFSMNYVSGINNFDGTHQPVIYIYAKYKDGTEERIWDLPNNKNVLIDGFYSKSITVEKEIIALSLGCYVMTTGNTMTDLVYNLQLEIGNTYTDYIEHQEQNYAIPLQEEMLKGDHFDFNNEQEVHTWGKVVFDGTENWYYNSTSGGFSLNGFNIKSPKGYCNCFKFIETYNTWQGLGKCGFNTNGTFWCQTNTFTSLNEWKTYLAEQYSNGTPIVVYYQLSEMKYLPFTEEQKQNIKELKQAKTYKGITHIYSNDKISPILNLNYKKDLETIINNFTALISSAE